MVETDVTQKCGLAERRFKLKSEARRPKISETIARLAVNGFGDDYQPPVRLTVEPGQGLTAPELVIKVVSVACRLS